MDFLDGKVRLHAGDCLEVLAQLDASSIDSCVTDPPYGLEFMGKEWDAPWQVSSASALFGKRQTKMPGWNVTRNANCRTCGGRLRGVKKCSCERPNWDEALDATRLRQMSAFQDWCQEWAEQVFRVLKPGAHLLAFGGTRTYHRLACAIEDAGFEIRDCIQWLYGSGFPKSHNVGNGWGTALKPAAELVVLARKPLSEGTVAANVLRWGTGAINVDGCRVGTSKDVPASPARLANGNALSGSVDGSLRRCTGDEGGFNPNIGRWPANVVHDGSEEVTAAFPVQTGAGGQVQNQSPHDSNSRGRFNGLSQEFPFYGDSGSAARFFYTAKADADDRLGSRHPTVKPVDLMQWLVRLVTPKGGTVLDPFAGTGTTGEAAWREGMRAVLVELQPDYQADIARRMALALAGPDERVRESVKARGLPVDLGPLFNR